MFTPATTRFDQSFLDAQRHHLMALRATLRGSRAAAVTAAAEVNASAHAEAREYGDDAQKLVALELEGTFDARDTMRLATIERALRKIEEGTYGLSDEGGEPIPIERLHASPEAIYTIAQQAALDAKR